MAKEMRNEIKLQDKGCAAADKQVIEAETDTT